MAAAGDTVAHYRLRRRLGTGAMGEVWLAEDTRLHRPVALKMLKSASAGDAAAAARLVREARVASTLSHPNVAVVYEVGEDAAALGCTYIAMEHVAGQTLAERAGGAPLAVAQLLPIARQVADALADAHAHGVVHRDVKPGNIMLGERGQVKVLDFGLARFAPPVDDESLTWSGDHGALEGGLAGTLAYMSPEQLRGRPLDGRSDVFSLGVTLYELSCGRRPFDAQDSVGLIDAILREPAAPLPAAGPLEAVFAALVARMIAKDPAQRPDMQAVVEALDDAASGRPLALGSPAAHTLAVASFANLTARAEDAWLGAGLAETLSAGLAALPGIAVVSRERIVEVVRALGLPEDAEAADVGRLGRELGASAVVSGAFQGPGEPMRVTARVVDTASGHVALTVKVDGLRSAIFELQDRLVEELAAGLRGQLAPPVRAPEDTHSLAAYEAYAKGLVNLQAESQESLDRAIAFFERAIALDPAYARAHMQLGAALDVKGDYLGMPEISERAVAAIERAIELRPDSAEAWRHKGAALITSGRDVEALAAFDLALSLDPTEAAAHSGMGRVHFLLRGEFAQAIRCFERALELNPKAGWTALQLANCAAYLRDFHRAEKAAHLAVELQQALLSGRAGLVVVGGFVRLGQSFALQGRHADALAEFARELAFLKSVDHALRGRIFIELHQRMGEAWLRLGDVGRGRAALDLAVEAFERRTRSGSTEPATPYYAACAYALRGEHEAALACLEAAAARRPRLTAARAPLEPALEPLRAEPRYRAIVAADPGALAAAPRPV